MDVRGAFPEVGRIESAELREKTVVVWEDALERGGWTVDDLDRIPASLHLVDTGISLRAHTRAVTGVAVAVADAFEAHYPDDVYRLNRDHLLAGSLLHDVGKVLEYAEADGGWVKSDSGRFVRHPFSGVAICVAHGVPPSVQQIVAFHSHEGRSFDRTPEATIVHYADFANFDPLR